MNDHSKNVDALSSARCTCYYEPQPCPRHMPLSYAARRARHRAPGPVVVGTPGGLNYLTAVPPVETR